MVQFFGSFKQHIIGSFVHFSQSIRRNCFKTPIYGISNLLGVTSPKEAIVSGSFPSGKKYLSTETCPCRTSILSISVLVSGTFSPYWSFSRTSHVSLRKRTGKTRFFGFLLFATMSYIAWLLSYKRSSVQRIEQQPRKRGYSDPFSRLVS